MDSVNSSTYSGNISLLHVSVLLLSADVNTENDESAIEIDTTSDFTLSITYGVSFLRDTGAAIIGRR